MASIARRARVFEGGDRSRIVRGDGTMDGITCLREAVMSVPIPGAPPRLSQDGAAVGLAFLDTALRQNHVRRLTQRLALIEHRAARCTTEVDISLGLLDEGQREAGLLYQRVRTRSEAHDRSRHPSDRGSGTGDGDLIWVPVSRVSRRSHSPIDVVDGAGVKLPRLTQYETSRLLASALYRLLRAILRTHPDARERSNGLHEFLFRKHKSRWLLQAALVSLLTERSKPAFQSARRAETPGTVHGDGARHRNNTLQMLAKYEKTLQDYLPLLDVAVNDYLLVVGLDASQDEHLLSFDSPLHVVHQAREHSLRRSLRLAGGAYWVEYRTMLPANLRAYHLLAETEPGIQIEKMYLASDADSSIVANLESDLPMLAARRECERRAPSGQSGEKILELELQTCLRRLSELLRRRRWEASQAGLVLSDEQTMPAASALAWAASSGEAIETDSGEPRTSLFRHPLVTTENLKAAADEIRQQELHLDLCFENHPASDRAHVYWRRDASEADVDQGIEVSSSMLLCDTSGSRPGSVVAYVVSVVGISYILGCLMFGSTLPYLGSGPLKSAVNADAVIAVLLLVPGFLYARLKLPARQSIAGQLRTLPRFVAHVTIGCVALLAATIAVSQNAALVRLALALCAVLPACAALLMVVMSRVVKAELILADARLPSWARNSQPAIGVADRPRRLSRLPAYRRLRDLYALPDVVFRTSGSES